MPTKLQAWHKRDDENDQQYELFLIYLRERSPIEVARIYFTSAEEDDFHNKRRVESGRIFIQNMKKDKQWDVRVRAYDRWVAKTRDDAIKKMVQDEVARIRSERLRISRHVARQVNRTFKELDDRDAANNPDKKVKLYERREAIKIAKDADEYWRKLEESNPAAADEDKPFEKEIASAQERLVAFLENKKAKAAAEADILQ